MVNQSQEEVWKPVIGYEQYYHVSNMGRVKSLERIVKNHSIEKIKVETIMKLTLNKYGYYTTNLTVGNKTHTVLVHRLVAQAFLPNPNNLPNVDHINRNRTDNRIENLRWCTYKENNNNPNTLQYVNEYVDKTARALRALETKAQNGSKVARKEVFQYTKEGILIASYPSITDAAKSVGVERHAIQCALNNTAYTCMGCIWATEQKEHVEYTPATTQSYYKAVQQLDSNGNVIKEWESVNSAARDLHTCTKQIRRLIKKGKFKYK